jgi:hypothetical protein
VATVGFVNPTHYIPADESLLRDSNAMVFHGFVDPMTGRFEGVHPKDLESLNGRVYLKHRSNWLSFQRLRLVVFVPSSTPEETIQKVSAMRDVWQVNRDTQDW